MRQEMTRERDPLRWFLCPSVREGETTSSEIAVCVDAVQRPRMTISSGLLALAKIVHDDDRLKAE
jgi:hypothetical protein